MSLADDIKATVGSNDVTACSGARAPRQRTKGASPTSASRRRHRGTCPRARRRESPATRARVTILPFRAPRHPQLNEVDDGADIQATLLEITGQRTVPNVFIKGQHLGGNDDLQASIASGKPGWSASVRATART